MMKSSRSLVVSLVMLLMVSCQEKKHPPIDATLLSSPLDRLMAGNHRFAAHKPEHPDEDLKHLKEVAKEQHPFAVIVGCSDSRVSPELLFDQGLGDLFVIRNAGNIIGNLEVGSIEYAVEHLGVKLVMIMGHEQCGAVKAMVEGSYSPSHIKDIIDSLKEEIEIRSIPIKDEAHLDEMVNANIRHAINSLKNQSPIIREKTENNALTIIGARYDLNDLRVTIIQQ